MTPNTPGTPIDDDDILDLTEVVQETPAAPAGPPEVAGVADMADPDDTIGADFGADLDALLDSLTAEAAPAQAAAPPPPAPQEAIAAPIANPTPAGHAVDPNETLPGMETSDIDSLLAELGVADAHEKQLSPPAPAPQPPAATNAPGGDAMGDILDDLPEDLVDLMGTVGDAPAAPQPAPPPPASAVPAADPDMDIPQGEDTIDLNELDALLDDMLATAPAPGPTPAPAPAPEAPAAAPAAQPVQEGPPAVPSIVATSAPSPAPAPAAVEPDHALEARLSALEAAFAILKAESALPPSVKENEENDRLEAIEARLSAMETAFAAMKAKEEAREALEMDAPEPVAATGEIIRTVDDLFVSGSPLMERIAEAVATALSSESGGPAAERFRGELEKMTAAAAARIIREEIGALAALSE